MSTHIVSLWYRAPEILLHGCWYGFPIDLWSVGLIFAELLNGQVLFQARSEPDQLPLVLENFLYCHASHTISSRAMFEKALALQYEGLAVLARPFGGIGLVYRKPFLVAQTERAAAARRGGGTGGAANKPQTAAAPTRGGQTAEISLDHFMKRRRINETVAGTVKAPAPGRVLGSFAGGRGASMMPPGPRAALPLPANNKMLGKGPPGPPAAGGAGAQKGPVASTGLSTDLLPPVETMTLHNIRKHRILTERRGLELLDGLLRLDPAARITAADAERHVFCREMRAASRFLPWVEL